MVTNDITRHFLDSTRTEQTVHITADREVTRATMTALWKIARERYQVRNSANVPAPPCPKETSTIVTRIATRNHEDDTNCAERLPRDTATIHDDSQPSQNTTQASRRP